MPDVSLRQTLLRRLLPGIFCGLLASGAALASVSVVEPTTDQLILRLDPEGIPDGKAKTATHGDTGLAARFEAIVRALGIEGLEIERPLDDTALVIRLTAPAAPAQLAKLIERLSKHPAVAHAEPDGRVHPAFVPNDPGIFLALQWYLYETYGIEAYAAWDIERGSAATVLALLDTGILPHEDLGPARRLPGYDFVDDDADATDPGDFTTVFDECGDGRPPENSSWHGLHLAGVMTAIADNATGVAGINHVSSLLPVRVLGKCGGYYSDIIDGIRWAAGLAVSGVPSNPNPAHVINLSLSAEQSCTVEIQSAIDAAVAAGTIVVAAAGNGNGTDVATTLPAGCRNVIAVAATDRAGRIESYSNLGSGVLLGAPGENIYSVYNAGTTVAAADSYQYISGTSVAAAQVTAAISLLLSAQPALTPTNVRQILAQTAQPYSASCPGGLPCGAGILDMHAALEMALNITPGDPVATTDDGGGGGGGCTLAAAGAGRGPDLAWLLVFGALGLLRIQSMRR